MFVPRAFPLVAILALAACASVKVRVDGTPGFRLPQSSAFAWVAGPVPAVPAPGAEPIDPFATNTLLDRRIRTAVADGMRMRGLSLVEKAEADHLLNYYVVIEDRVAIRSYSGAYTGVYNHGLQSGVYAPSALRHYSQGTLMLDVIDPRTDEIRWRGWAIARLKTETFSAEQVRDLVERILERLPIS